MRLSLSVAGKDFNQKVKTTIVESYTVKSVTGKTVRMEKKTESVEVLSSGDSMGGQLEKIMEKLKGASFIFTLTDGKVTKFEGYNEFLKKVSGDDEYATKFAKEMLSERLLKKSLEMTFGELPSKAVKVGDTWSQNNTIPFELGDFKAAQDFTFKKRDKEGAELTFKGNITFAPPKGAGLLGGMLKIVKGKAKSDNFKGTRVFDIEKGRLVRATSAMQVRSALTVEIMGNQLDLDFRIDQTTTTRMLAKNPKSD